MSTRKPEVHPVDAMLPLGPLFVYGLQHVLAMYAGAVAVNWAAGGNPAAPDYGDPRYAVLAFAVMVFILLIYRFFTGFIANVAVMLGLVLGTLVAIPLGFTNFSRVGEAGWLGITTPF